MGSPLPEDPYIALGVAKDAPNALIKSTYRKAALKFHPDKVTDENQKAAAADQFHRIQTAYEIIGDDERRARYDAQVKLAELRRDVLQKQGGVGRGVEVRTAMYEMPTAGGRAAYAARGPERLYEDRRPSFDADYFDTPRPGARKDREHERPVRSTTSRTGASVRGGASVREKVKVEKENERSSRTEKTLRRDADIQRDRDYKRRTAYVEEDTDSSSDDTYAAYERVKRVEKVKKKEYRERVEQERARQEYHEKERKQKESAAQGYYDPRSAKTLAQDSDARDYIQRAERSGRRPSPNRVSSSARSVVEAVRASERPAAVRRDSDRSRVVVDERRSPRTTSKREFERRASADIVEEPKPRPPTLQPSKSAPGQIHLPNGRTEPVRATSMQAESVRPDEFVPPAFSRSSTMPNVSSRTRKECTIPVRPSLLRQTESVQGQATPSATPGYPSSQYSYRKQYADDHEYPTPDGYKTEVREPGEPRRDITRSPSPMASREKPTRTTSSRTAAAPPPPNLRTTSYSYVVTPEGVQSRSPQDYSPQDTLRREQSSRARSGQLYGEISTSPPQATYEYPSPPQSGKYSPAEEDVRYQKFQAPKMASGYRARRREDRGNRPTVSRSNSYGIHVR